MTIKQLIGLLQGIAREELLAGIPATVECFTEDPLDPSEFEIEGIKITVNRDGVPYKAVILLGGVK